MTFLTKEKIQQVRDMAKNRYRNDLPPMLMKDTLDALLDQAELALKYREVLEKIERRNRARGYPTGGEWEEVIYWVRAAISEAKDE